MAYYMGLDGNDIRGTWEPCEAATLTGAKREASRRFGGGYHHHRIVLGADVERVGPHGNYTDREQVAARPMGGRWESR